MCIRDRKWRDEYGTRIVKQLHKLGSSADWDRERFTMDEGCSDAVLEVFIKLYEKGYIYKGSRIVNWCPVCKTSISDAEVEHVEPVSYTHLHTDRKQDRGTGKLKNPKGFCSSGKEKLGTGPAPV